MGARPRSGGCGPLSEGSHAGRCASRRASCAARHARHFFSRSRCARARAEAAAQEMDEPMQDLSKAAAGRGGRRVRLRIQAALPLPGCGRTLGACTSTSWRSSLGPPAVAEGAGALSCGAWAVATAASSNELERTAHKDPRRSGAGGRAPSLRGGRRGRLAGAPRSAGSASSPATQEGRSCPPRAPPRASHRAPHPSHAARRRR